MKVPDGSAACICRRLRRHGLDPWVRKSSWKWQPTPLFLPGKSHGWEEHGRLQSMRFQRVDHDWARTAYEIMCNNIMNGIFSIIVFNWLSLTFINMYVYIYSEEGNGNPLQYSCLENPMDRGTWLAAVHGVTKSRTQLSD